MPAPPLRRSGILLHPSCLPGPHGSGDLGPSSRHFVDWLVAAGQQLWQVLPLTPIGPGNSPYASVSAFAGNPLLVALEPLVEAGWLAAPRAEACADFGRDHIDFDRVTPWRMARLRDAWQGFRERATAAERQTFSSWSAGQADWLDDYALFMALDAEARALHGRDNWTQWDPAVASRQAAALALAREGHADEILHWKFVQWCFDCQWTALRNYAAERGIGMVGDLPIFVAHHSADCWAHPGMFWLDARGMPAAVAGVPPDFFSATGQHWGNPLYRWDVCAADGYAWWLARMRRQLAQADMVRIDHFRGFAAYWEIPVDASSAVHGRWRPGPGKALFEHLQAGLGRLPIIAEDLGVITEDVRALRDGFGLPGMRILQFGFGGRADHPYLPHNYRANSVAYTGTHDNDTVVGWWNACSEAERGHVLDYLGEPNEAFHWRAIRAVSASVADTTIFPMQDVLGLDSRHRLNTPGSVGCWTWRFRWDWVGPEPAERLHRLTRTYGRVPLPPEAPASYD